MKREDLDNRKKDTEQNHVSENQNPSLQDPAASSVADYGRSEQNPEELKQNHGKNSEKGNSGLPMDNEDTLGIP